VNKGNRTPLLSQKGGQSERKRDLAVTPAPSGGTPKSVNESNNPPAHLESMARNPDTASKSRCHGAFVQKRTRAQT